MDPKNAGKKLRHLLPWWRVRTLHDPNLLRGMRFGRIFLLHIKIRLTDRLKDSSTDASSVW